MIVFSLDDVIKDPDAYVDDILSRGFTDVPDGDKVFKGIQPRPHDELQSFVMTMFPDYVTTYNFVRQSSLHQVEPNFIHTDEMMRLSRWRQIRLVANRRTGHEDPRERAPWLSGPLVPCERDENLYYDSLS